MKKYRIKRSFFLSLFRLNPFGSANLTLLKRNGFMLRDISPKKRYKLDEKLFYQKKEAPSVFSPISIKQQNPTTLPASSGLFLYVGL
jgi:hypothetical protein